VTTILLLTKKTFRTTHSPRTAKTGEEKTINKNHYLTRNKRGKEKAQL
jgi:hypothetical protein